MKPSDNQAGEIMGKKLLGAARGLVCWLAILLFGFLTAVSLFSTTYFTTDSSFGERPEYRMDFVLLNLIFLVFAAAVLYFINKSGILERISVRGLAAAAVLFVTGVSILWIQVSHTYPEADQKAVSWMAYLFTQDNFLFFEPGKYMQIYPNQLGLTAILEGLYRLTGGENWKAFMYLTAFANGCVVFLLYRITHKLYGSKKADCLVLLLSMGCVQVMLYTTFLYGIMLGLAFALGAFALILRYLETGRLWQAALAGFLIGISVLVKNNYSIVLVALVLLLLYRMFAEKKWKHGLSLLLLILLTGLLSKGLTVFYEQRSGMELGSGMPKSLWVAMGMQEGERAEGWYNEFNFNTFVETGCDAEESNRLAKEAILESLEAFQRDPAYALRFYYKKTVSQWNEPTYEALWVNQFHSGEFSRIVQSIYDGKLYQLLNEYMNFYQLLIFGAVLWCLLKYRRRAESAEKEVWETERLFLPLVILGGFFFHTLWEAKSQYIFPYFVCMLPGAAAGLSDWTKKQESILLWIKRKTRKNSEENRQ